ncbi:MAG: DUF3617 family protein [Sphingomicrobium sp.]
MRVLLVAAPLLLLAACSDDAPPVDKRASEAKQLAAGAYEVQAKVETLTATDTGKPATKMKLGDTTVLKGCVAADGTPDASLFIEPGDACKPTQSYSSGAILNIQYHCARKGTSGSVNYSISGEFTADTFTAKSTEGTSFTTPDDYTLIRDLKAKRVGNCAAPSAPPAKS